MAKIWDKIKDSVKCRLDEISKIGMRVEQKRLMNARRNLDFVKMEIADLDNKYAEKMERKQNSFIRRANSKLAKPAFLACDKSEYFDAIFDEKMTKYDKRAYMKMRAVNHGTAKTLFKAINAGTETDSIFEAHKVKVEALHQKREEYLAKLEEERKVFLEKNNVVNEDEYNKANEQLVEQYNQSCIDLEGKFNEQKEKELARLKAKEEKLQAKTDEITGKYTDRRGVEEDVVLSVKNLKMYFGGLKAVDDLSFDVKRGEIFGLIGPNGAGKTTVFNCITRFYNATGGDMLFENKHGEIVDMRDFKVHDVILQGISRTFQNIELVKEVSVLENLLVACTRSYRTGIFAHAIGLPLLNKEEKIFRQKAMKILKFMGIENYAGWYAMGLPYGILKKVEIARALMAEPKLIIMDEPAAGLNDAETKELTETIRRIRDTFGVTILLVEHDMGLVMDVCDTVCAISFGQMLAIGTTEEIQNNRAVQEAYLGVEEDESTTQETTDEKEVE